MSTQTITKKRKSVDGTTTVSKKVKTAKSADRPAPLKSALKKKTTTMTVEEPKKTTTDVPKRTKKIVEEVEETVIAPADPISASTTDLTPDQTAALLAGFSSDEEGSASEDDAGIAVSKLPKAPTSAISKQLQKNCAEDPDKTPGTVYIGRIPHGFYEHQMRAYFSQFGDITHLRLMRNRKTGKSQHHGFIEFASASVADIVFKTMDKYLLFGHILQVKKVPQEQVNERMWLKSSRRARNPPPRNKMEGSLLRRGATREVWEARVEREQKKRTEKAEKLKDMGYEFEMPVVKRVDGVAVKPKALEGGVVVVETPAEVVKDVVVAVEEATVEEPAAVEVVEKKSKKRSAQGKTEIKKAVKKVKA